MLHYTEPIMNAFINETEVCRRSAFPHVNVLFTFVRYIVLGQEIERVRPERSGRLCS